MKKFDENAERQRLFAMSEYERRLRGQGFALIAGVDEAGRGPLAGPVVACAAVLPADALIYGLNDSKKLSAKKRAELDVIIRETAVAYGIGTADNETIDRVNIRQAVFLAMNEAVNNLKIAPDYILFDGSDAPPCALPHEAVTAGDARSVSIAAASIIAKQYRDALMPEYDRLWPQYGFAAHKGYGTEAHLRAIAEYGPCPIHRRTFIKSFVKDNFLTARRGGYGEEIARKYLDGKGYEILAARYKAGGGEIDIIAKRGGCYAFVEVKYRKTLAFGFPRESVTADKQRRIRGAALAYIEENGLDSDPDCDFRFDVIEIIGQGTVTVEHIENAF